MVDIQRLLPIKLSVIGTVKPKHNARPNCNTDPFLQEVTDSLEKHYSTPEFNVLSLALDLNLSRSYMARKIKKKTGLTSGEYIKTFRMEKAHLLLTAGMTGSITEVAYAVGFKNHSYFSHTFKEHFGKTPSEFLEEKAGI
ncbi:helix-turn-helix domain-containing protein [Rhodohalobacter sp. 8-1]|uniref:helix-turn-helix domain-containing protein n=1 Tax=Rhodohalobacter sp. 8-1 TaxID=3131972 RepID=UPI0030ED948B